MYQIVNQIGLEGLVDRLDFVLVNCQSIRVLSYDKGDIIMVLVYNRSLYVFFLMISEVIVKLKIEKLLVKNNKL